MRSFIRHHPFGVGTGVVVVIAGLAWLAFGFFGVHTLFVDDVVEESGPVFDTAPVSLETDNGAATSTPTESATQSADPTPVEASPVEASTTGAPDDSLVSVTPTEQVDTAQVDTGPVTTEPSAAPAIPEIVTEYRGVFLGDAHPTAGDAVVLGNGTGQRFLRLENFETDNGPDLNVYLVNSSTGDVSDYVDLGDLKGNIGDQNYEIPEDVDLDVYDEVVIWCVRFGVGFGDARLMPV